MGKKISIFVGPAQEGAVPLVYLHTEAIDLSGLGLKEAPRVSDIEFNTTTQQWEARLLDGTLIATGNSRDELINAERLYIDEKFRKGEEIPKE